MYASCLAGIGCALSLGWACKLMNNFLAQGWAKLASSTSSFRNPPSLWDGTPVEYPVSLISMCSYTLALVGIDSTCAASWVYRIAEQEHESDQCCCAGENLHSIPKHYPTGGRLRPKDETGKRVASEKCWMQSSIRHVSYCTSHI